MAPSPTPTVLALAATDRAIILHADDLGMCHAANVAFARLSEAGLAVSESVMIACPWFPELAAWARALSWPTKRVRRKDSGSGRLFLLGDGQRGWKAVMDRTWLSGLGLESTRQDGSVAY